MPELIWDGKYNEDGQLAASPRVSLPFQTVETVNQSAQERQMSLTANQRGTPGEWRNRLIWGDKKYVLSSLLEEFAGKVDLIYIDPPFATGADFSYRTEIHSPNCEPDDDSLELEYQPNLIEQIAYRDTWGGGLDTYIKWMFDTLILLRDLLSEEGSIYVHCDWRTVHCTRMAMDEILGQGNFLNEIIWHYFAFKRKTARKFPQKHDQIFSYTKSGNYTWNTQYRPHSKEYLKRWKKDRNGRYYRDDVNPTGGGKRIIYLDELEGDIVESTWDDIPPVNPRANERVGYPTQKPEALLERIVKASSNEGGLVLDCFVGSGTTAIVAENLGRRWIAADMSRFAISTTRKRLLSLENVSPFYIQNLGRYERQAWQGTEFNSGAAIRQYRDFILKPESTEGVGIKGLLKGCKGAPLNLG